MAFRHFHRRLSLSDFNIFKVLTWRRWINVWKTKKNDDRDDFTWENETEIQGSIPQHESILHLEAAFKVREKGLFIVTPLCQCGGIIHKDIKPQNLFLRKHGKGAMLGDFGRSKRHLDSENIPELPRPQTEYAAPEQQGMGTGGFPVDVWALGITLYEVVIEVRPDLDGEFHLLLGMKFFDRSKDFKEVIKAMLTPE
ncbi:Sperm motility kinase 2A [Linnemannia elongata]|nr:Sperm motility kinase 2A [Linnemannia elongata]